MVIQTEFNVWNRWDPLQTILIGTPPDSKFYSDIRLWRNQKPMLELLDETHKDLNYLVDVLEQYGVRVLRQLPNKLLRFDPAGDPNIPSNQQATENYNFVVLGKQVVSNHNGYRLMPQWEQMFGGPRAFDTSPDTVWFELTKILASIKQHVRTCQWNIVGQHLFVNYFQFKEKTAQWRNKWIYDLRRWINKWFPTIKLRLIPMQHKDHMKYITVKPGVLIANSPASDYTKYFPGWDVLHVPDKEFKLKIIMIDQKTACINSKDKKILDYLRKHHVDTEYTPLRNCERWHQFAHWLYIDILRQGQPHDHLFHASGTQRYTFR